MSAPALRTRRRGPAPSALRRNDTCRACPPRGRRGGARLDVELADRTPQLLTRELAEQVDVVVTMGCGDACPYIPGKRYIDPKGRPLDDVRAIRDDIHARVQQLVTELDIAVA